jgi:hypothetical protein
MVQTLYKSLKHFEKGQLQKRLLHTQEAVTNTPAWQNAELVVKSCMVQALDKSYKLY